MIFNVNYRKLHVNYCELIYCLIIIYDNFRLIYGNLRFKKMNY